MTELAPSAGTFSPLRPRDRSRAWRIGAIVVGTVILAVASRIEVPMVPVPMTMQTFAVTLIGALYGWRLGAATVLAWLAQGALGLPVFAGGAGGLAHFAGPTAGYLAGFVVAAALTGFLAERGWNGDRPARALVSMLAGNAVILALGGAWLGVMIGAGPALAAGVTPFVLGAALKSALAVMALRGANRFGPAR
ncbi:MAG: biotin transporter BioY [Rhodovulum sulfidophilum]|uniref:Biotin transporter n=1 Tax=Rhodovulum sulfidophilum TaxID=35806 RepID=A0A2W5N8P4_RHOSU|nr:MAG: biotin transporter BioY [Rhodovulum sulfidophilum]